ncbi:MAG: hypothetical protein V4458_14030 [Pseudomonadota bacterium]|nr:hypothetical protein [Afipia sp.]
MMRFLIAAVLLAAVPHQAMAQDVPGIEICTAEKTMERRTGCLQSNVNFLKASLTKASLENQQKIDAANRQIDALKATVIGLQNTVTQLQAQVQALGKQPNGAAAKEAPKEAPKAPAAK